MFDPKPDGGRAPAGVPAGAVRERRHRSVLWTVTALNGAIVLTALAAGRVAGAHALAAGALPALGAALTTGLALATAGAPFRTRRVAALAKAALLTGAGLAVLGGTVRALLGGALPLPALMGGVALAILGAHLASMLLLLPYRAEPAFRGALAAALHGAFGQAFVGLAALGVWASGSDWPDLVVAANLAALFLLSALQVLRQAVVEWRTGEDQGAVSSHGFHEDFA